MSEDEEGAETRDRVLETAPLSDQPVSDDCFRGKEDTLFDALLALTPLGVAVLDPDLHVVRLNDLLAAMAGRPGEELIGKPLAEILPALTDSLTPLLHRALAGDVPAVEGYVSDESVSISGLKRRWHVSCRSLPPVRSYFVRRSIPETAQTEMSQAMNAGGVIVVFESEASDSTREPTAGGAGPTHDGIQPLSETTRSLILEIASRVATDILASQTGRDALERIAEAARTLSGARYAALGVARHGGDGLLEFITVGLTPEEEAAIGPRPRGAGVLGLLLTRTEPLRIDTLRSHPASVGFPPEHPPMGSFLGVPIRQGDTVLGSLYLTEKEGGSPFTEADEVAIQALGAHAAVAIHNFHQLNRQRILLSGLISAQEEERKAVAYELHDGLTQYVIACKAHLEVSRRAREEGDEERSEHQWQMGLQCLKEAVIESRRLVNGLRTLALDDLGLAGALEQLLAEEKARAGWKAVHLTNNVPGRRYDKAVETAAFRVAQEALTNARKHARTDSVQVLLITTVHPDTDQPLLTLEVRDDGIGFTPEEKLTEYGHLGLHGMSERVHLLGGAYEVRSAPGAGTVVRATFPALEPRVE